MVKICLGGFSRETNAGNATGVMVKTDVGSWFGLVVTGHFDMGRKWVKVPTANAARVTDSSH